MRSCPPLHLSNRGRGAASKAANSSASPDRDGRFRDDNLHRNGHAKLLGDTLFRPPPAKIGVLAAQVYQALETMGTQETAVKAEIRLGATRHILRHPVQMIEPVEQSGHDCGVDATLRAGKSLPMG